MTGTEICAAARALAPHIQLRDVWHLLREMQERSLVTCHNPRLVTGRLYEHTARGRAAVAVAFGIAIPTARDGVDWRGYSWVVRAKVRRLTLLGLATLERKSGESQTATAVRKHLCTEHPIGLDRVVPALKELLRLGLVREAGVTHKGCCKLYQLTPAGRRIVEQLKR